MSAETEPARSWPDRSGRADDLCAIEVVAGDEALVLRISGELCVATAPRLAEVLDAALDTGFTAAVIDLADVTLLSAAGIGVLVSRSLRFADSGGRLRVRDPRPIVRLVLEVTGTLWLLGGPGDALTATPRRAGSTVR